jgi:hypothetical protein
LRGQSKCSLDVEDEILPSIKKPPLALNMYPVLVLLPNRRILNWLKAHKAARQWHCSYSSCLDDVNNKMSQKMSDRARMPLGSQGTLLAARLPMINVRSWKLPMTMDCYSC